MNTRRTTLIVALVVAVLTGWLTLNYLSSIQRSSAVQNQPTEILVAAQEIPARVPITAAMLAKATRPAAAVEPDALTDPSKVIGALSLITIPAGSTITLSKVGHPADVGLPVRLTPGMRAISISIDKVKGVSGLIEPGDRVDVVAIPPKSTAVPPPASTILRGIRVLAVGPLLENTSATPPPEAQVFTTITLEVTPKQVDLIEMADLNTVLRLALRSPREPINSAPVEALHFPDGSGGGTQMAAAAAPPPDAATLALQALAQRQNQPAQPQAPPVYSGVQIIDGDRYVTPGSGQSPP
ncbi:MAG TPA: Flp pilus assembly protein CpaB [Candidatus Rubrimentiphilum sp.]|nr:Flp pilus assembly protein CpaB [Candidatus Rubrimentiphilum sp.]